MIVTYYSIIMKPVKRCTLGISRGKGRKKDERLRRFDSLAVRRDVTIRIAEMAI